MVVGVIDEPIKGGGTDTLDIGPHAKSLENFIQQTDTPITIGVQGEWGSGKTSLLNTIYFTLEQQKKYKLIWINSWEQSLLVSPEETLLKIINEIISELLVGDDGELKKQIKDYATTVFKGALRIGTAAALGSGASDVAKEIMSRESGSIRKLRNGLEKLGRVLINGHQRNRPRRMSALPPKADINPHRLECLLCAKSGHHAAYSCEVIDL